MGRNIQKELILTDQGFKVYICSHEMNIIINLVTKANNTTKLLFSIDSLTDGSEKQLNLVIANQIFANQMFRSSSTAS